MDVVGADHKTLADVIIKTVQYADGLAHGIGLAADREKTATVMNTHLKALFNLLQMPVELTTKQGQFAGGGSVQIQGLLAGTLIGRERLSGGRPG